MFGGGQNADDIKKLLYLGSDISEMMNRGAELLHPECKFKFSTADTVHSLVEDFKDIGLFYGLSISLRYALREAQDLIDAANNSGIVILNRLSLARGKTRKIEAGTGKYAYVISIEELQELLKRNKVYAKISTGSMQLNKDGENTVRVSIVMSREKRFVDDFMKLYDGLIINIKEQSTVEVADSEWRDISEL